MPLALMLGHRTKAMSAPVLQLAELPDVERNRAYTANSTDISLTEYRATDSMQTTG